MRTALFLLGIILKGADHVTTAIALHRGMATEGNPIIRWLTARASANTAMVLIDLLYVLLFGLAFWQGAGALLFGATDVILGAVVIWNVHILRGEKK